MAPGLCILLYWPFFMLSDEGFGMETGLGIGMGLVIGLIVGGVGEVLVGFYT